MQDAYNLRNDYGPSDYDARHRFVVNGVYDLPFKGNRLAEGWEVSTILQLQSGNPINFRTTNASLTGIGGELRPSISEPVHTGHLAGEERKPHYGFVPSEPRCALRSRRAFRQPGPKRNLRSGLLQPGLRAGEEYQDHRALTWQVRADAFDLLNQKNFTQPVTSVPSSQTFGSTVPASSTFGLITGGHAFPGRRQRLIAADPARDEADFLDLVAQNGARPEHCPNDGGACRALCARDLVAQNGALPSIVQTMAVRAAPFALERPT